MQELKRLIEEIRALEGVKPGDPMRGNPDQGHLGQTIDNLTHTDEGADNYGAWKDVRCSEAFRAQVTETAKGYLEWLKKQRAS